MATPAERRRRRLERLLLREERALERAHRDLPEVGPLPPQPPPTPGNLGYLELNRQSHRLRQLLLHQERQGQRELGQTLLRLRREGLAELRQRALSEGSVLSPQQLREELATLERIALRQEQLWRAELGAGRRSAECRLQLQHQRLQHKLGRGELASVADVGRALGRWQQAGLFEPFEDILQRCQTLCEERGLPLSPGQPLPPVHPYQLARDLREELDLVYRLGVSLPPDLSMFPNPAEVPGPLRSPLSPEAEAFRGGLARILVETGNDLRHGLHRAHLEALELLVRSWDPAFWEPSWGPCPRTAAQLRGRLDALAAVTRQDHLLRHRRMQRIFRFAEAEFERERIRLADPDLLNFAGEAQVASELRWASERLAEGFRRDLASVWAATDDPELPGALLRAAANGPGPED